MQHIADVDRTNCETEARRNREIIFEYIFAFRMQFTQMHTLLFSTLLLRRFLPRISINSLILHGFYSFLFSFFITLRYDLLWVCLLVVPHVTSINLQHFNILHFISRFAGVKKAV